LITVDLRGVQDRALAARIVGTTAVMAFYDWEANALTPNGKTVESQLQSQDPTATTISQGSGSSAPGESGSGSMGLYDAVRLASKQPYEASSDNSRTTNEYYMFGSPGSAACAAAARDQGIMPVAGQYCYLNGPDDNLHDLKSEVPAGVNAAAGEILTVLRGTVVVQAIPEGFAHPVRGGNPSAQFFVLKDNVALRGSDITNPQQSTDPNTSAPDVTFGFSGHGKSLFQNVTAEIARRGSLDSGLGQSLNQHFAMVLDNQLITVPQIDYKQYPNGINGDNGADISGNFTTSSAQDLANEVRLGGLPVSLTLIAENAT
jgi:preprotein translocase subunit SecD